MSDKCYYCDNVATKLCDFIIDKKKRLTCDKRLCADHATVISRGFACSRSGKNKGCHPITTDYCPGHAKVSGHWPPQEIIIW